MNRQMPPSRDWTLYVYAAPPHDRDPTKQLDTRRIELEPCGTFESVQFNLTFPYYRNVAHKAIIVKGRRFLFSLKLN